ncbi:bacteriorhodopsin [Hymenobacter sp. BT559]|uniref:bacteriorhodopsin n=1 Tax=Hymenobacter sp. BT559 TaxID=2795729 RepID=UPI0018ED60C3|nr:bacteriorhodopsin [Hymenobacter sp. BT559]MBJ6143532.1 bacteriorhodopsin [Hymenobacter sp. BT559]
MTFGDSFVPTAGEVGILSMLTYFFMAVAAYSFLGNLIFSLATQSSVAPEHRISRVYGAIIAAVAGVSYLLITHFYHEFLHELSRQGAHTTAGEILTRQSYQAIGQLRYIDWAVTTPLLLLKTVSMLRISFREATKAIIVLLVADFFMVLTGYIGEQQLTATGEIIASGKLLWGAISTLGYLVVPFVLYGLYKRFGARGHEQERWGFRFMAYTTVTSWGVYPLGYLLTLTSVNLNYIHLAFSMADIFNKTGVAIVAYLVSKRLLDERLDEKKIIDGYSVV